MKRDRLVSVIMPVFNAEDFLEETITDLLKQTHNDMEIIIIDDGSTDHSWEIIQRFAQADGRIKAIHIENGGPAKARNIGLDIAVGEYVRFIDADDRIPETSIEIMVSYYGGKREIDLVIGNYQTIPEKAFFTGEEYQDEILSQEAFSARFVKNMKSFYFGVPWNKLYKRNLIEKYDLRFSEEIVWCEDLLFNLDYYNVCKKIRLFSTEGGIYHYYERENSITSTLAKRNKREVKSIEELRYARVIDYFKPYGLEQDASMEWKYSDLYSRLFNITRLRQNTPIKERYQKFKELLQQEEVYQFVCYKQHDSRTWGLIRHVIEKKCYVVGFFCFSMKGIVSRGLGKVSPKIKSRIKSKIPKAL